MSGLICIYRSGAIYDYEEAVSDIKLQIAKDYNKYNKRKYEYNIYQSDENNKWYIETKIFKKLNPLNDKFIIEI
jgi:hypothetical protein